MSDQYNTFECHLVEGESDWVLAVSDFDDLAAVSYDIDGLFQNDRCTCCIYNDCYAFRSCDLFYSFYNVFFVRYNEVCCSKFLCQWETNIFILGHSDCDDLSCTSETGCIHCEKSHCAASEYNYVLSRKKSAFLDHRFITVAERVHHGCFFIFYVIRNLVQTVREYHQDISRDLYIFSKSAVHVISHSFTVCTEEVFTFAACVAYTAYMTGIVRYNSVADFPSCYFRSYFTDLASKFMSDNDRVRYRFSFYGSIHQSKV